MATRDVEIVFVMSESGETISAWSDASYELMAPSEAAKKFITHLTGDKN